MDKTHDILPDGNPHASSAALRVLEALRILVRAPESLSLKDLREQLNASEATAFRAAETLCAAGLAARNGRGRGYRPTLAVVEMAADLLERRGVRDIARPVLVNLAEEFGESVTLALPAGDHVVFVDRVGNRRVEFYCDTGRRLPLHVGAAARCILAHYPDRQFAAYLERELESFTPSTKTAVAELEEDREAIRANGYALSVGDVEVGISAVGSAFLNGRSEILGAVAIANLSARWDEASVNKRASRLAAAAQELSHLCRSLPTEGVAL